MEIHSAANTLNVINSTEQNVVVVAVRASVRGRQRGKE